MIKIFYLIAVFAFASIAVAQDEARLSKLESRVARVEGKAARASAAGAVGFLFGAFCALWAQNTGRNAWLWFFVGLFFSVITVLVLLSKNSDDLKTRRAGG